MHGNGFFIKDHRIVCPAHLVVIPPTVLASANRYPFVSATPVTPTDVVPNYITKVSKILVDVYDVNNKCKSYTYEAKLCAVDPAGDIAFLKIKKDCQFNKCNPKIDSCHPYFRWGRSRKAPIGRKIYALGNTSTSWRPDRVLVSSNQTDTFISNKPGITGGLLQDNKYIDYGGFAQQELILTDLQIYNNKTGLPIVDGRGLLLGMQTTNEQGTGIKNGSSNNYVDGFVAGPSENFMRPVLKAFLSSRKSKLHCKHVEKVIDAAGNFCKYKKGYLGVAWDAVTGPVFNTSISTGNTGATGTYVLNLEVENCRKLEGVRVITVAGSTEITSAAYVPGGTALLNVGGYNYPPGGVGHTGATGAYGTLSMLPTSPLLGTVFTGDILTKIGSSCLLGNYNDCQIAPSLITWRKVAGDEVCIEYKKVSNNYTTKESTKVTLLDFPPFMDYPWYKVNKFPQSTFLLTNPFPYLPGTNFRPAF